MVGPIATEIHVVLPYLEYILWLRLLHTAENHGPTMFHMATVRHK